MIGNAWKNVKDYFRSLYLNYLLVTELYMVEDWEKVVIHMVFTLIFSLFWYFNYSIVFNAISHFRRRVHHVEDVF